MHGRAEGRPGRAAVSPWEGGPWAGSEAPSVPLRPRRLKQKLLSGFTSGPRSVNTVVEDGRPALGSEGADAREHVLLAAVFPTGQQRTLGTGRRGRSRWGRWRRASPGDGGKFLFQHR